MKIDEKEMMIESNPTSIIKPVHIGDDQGLDYLGVPSNEVTLP